jgi:predicted nucleotidyltransferase
MSAVTGEHLSEADFEAWLERLISRWPQVDSVHLTGSRSRGMDRPDSDWDIIVCLTAECYEEIGRNANRFGEWIYYQPLDKIEQQIAFDVELRHEAIDLFFMDPGGALRRWQWLEVKELLDILPDEEQAVLEALIGEVESLLELPEEEALERLEQACKAAAPQELETLEHFSAGDLYGDFDRLYRSLSDAKELYQRTVD